MAASALLFRAISADYDMVNFELALHAVESLQAYSAAETFSAELEDIRPILLAFTELNDRSRHLASYPLLTELRLELMSAIARRVAADARASHTSHPSTFREATKTVRSLTAAFTVRAFTLNYDTVMDSMEEWRDGFRSKFGKGYATFRRLRFLEQLGSDEHTLCHLHGSVLYGYHRAESAIVKYSDAEAAINSYRMAKGPKADPAGELALSAPIISGLRKLEKLNSTPYGYYYNAFSSAIMRNPRLVVIGYGFNDAHINYWLGQHKVIHGNRRRVVLITRGKAAKPGRDDVRGDFRSAARRLYSTAVSQPTANTFAYEGDRGQTMSDLMVVHSGFPLVSRKARDMMIAHLQRGTPNKSKISRS